MKRTKCISTSHIIVDLREDDFLAVKIGEQSYVKIDYNIASLRLNLSLIRETDPINKTPLLSISKYQMENLEDKHIDNGYINLTYPSTLDKEVKERLKGLPIVGI